MKTPNEAYFLYQSQNASSSMMMPSSRSKPEEKISLASMQMYNSVVSPNINVPSINSNIRIYPHMKTPSKRFTPPTPTNRQFTPSNEAPTELSETSNLTTILRQTQQLQKYKNRQEIYKLRILDLNNQLLVKENILKGFQQQIEQQSNSTALINRLSSQLSLANNQISILKQKVQEGKQQERQLKNKQQEVKRQKTLIQQLQNRDLSNLYQTNLPKMNKDKEFYVFKLIECENTLRQRDLKISELEKIQKIIIKQMDDIKNKGSLDKTNDVKKYLERQQQLIKTITKYKMDLHGRDLQLKRVKAASQADINILKQQNQDTKTLLEKNTKEYELQNAILKQKTKDQDSRISFLSKEVERSIASSINSEKQQLLQSKLVDVLKQIQVTNSEYQQYKSRMDQDILKISSENKKLEAEIQSLRQSSQKIKKNYDHLYNQNQQYKKISQERERTLSVANISATRRCTELEIEIKNLRVAIQDKNNQMHEHQKSIKNGIKIEHATDIQLATLKSEREGLQEKVKGLELKIVENQFSMKLVENLQTQNKYMKETVKMQTAQIVFLKKQHLEVIESMINLNQKKSLQQSVVKTQKFTDLSNLFQKHQKNYQTSRNVNLNELFQELYKLFQKKYQFLKFHFHTVQGLSPRSSLITHGEYLQNSGSYQDDATMTIFYEQHFKGLLMLFDIEQGEGCQTQLNEKIKQLMNNNIKFQQQTKDLRSKVNSLEITTKQNNQQLDKKNKILQELGKHAAKLQSNVAVAVEKLIKYEQLLDQANKTIMTHELIVFSSKHQLSSLKQSFQIDKQSFVKQIQILQTYLKQILKTVNDSPNLGSEQSRSIQQMNRIDFVLYKLFLKQASQDNLQLNEQMLRMQSGQMGEEIVCLKYSALWDIKQYYKNMLLPQIHKILIKNN